MKKDDNATNKANRDSIKKTLANAETVNAKLVSHDGTCETGVTAVYKASGKTEDGTRYTCLLYTSDAADDLLCVDLGGRRLTQKKNKTQTNNSHNSINNNTKHKERWT